MGALWEILEGARNPAGLLRVKIREMEDGTFRGGSVDKDVEEMGKKYGLDAQAIAKLAEVLSKREDRVTDLKQIAKHLQKSNRPSSLMMIMLKDLRAGLPVKDPEFPAAVGSYAHRMGMKRGSHRSRSRGKQKKGKTRSRRRSDRRSSKSSSSSPPPAPRRTGAGP